MRHVSQRQNNEAADEGCADLAHCHDVAELRGASVLPLLADCSLSLDQCTAIEPDWSDALLGQLGCDQREQRRVIYLAEV